MLTSQKESTLCSRLTGFRASVSCRTLPALALPLGAPASQCRTPAFRMSLAQDNLTESKRLPTPHQALQLSLPPAQPCLLRQKHQSHSHSPTPVSLSPTRPAPRVTGSFSCALFVGTQGPRAHLLAGIQSASCPVPFQALLFPNPHLSSCTLAQTDHQDHQRTAGSGPQGPGPCEVK
jgi:hypothetical protein